MIMNLFRILLGVLLLSVTQSDALAAKVSCTSYQSPMLEKKVGYCIQRSRPDLAPQAGEPVIYFMHGLWGGAGSWKGNGYGEALEVLSARENYPAFTVVSFDTTGTSFFSDPERVHPGRGSFESWLVQEFMPRIEANQNLCSKRECRAIAGISMGGLGALKTSLRYPDLFIQTSSRQSRPPRPHWVRSTSTSPGRSGKPTLTVIRSDRFAERCSWAR
jgi:S-formylglutathione hydrolase FrmB